MQHTVRPDIGQQIKELRTQANLSQAELAAIIGVTANTIQNVEYGNNFSMRILLKILDALEITEFTIKIKNNEPEVNN